ncbi:hypothetical protein EJ02DRAFT_90856 [Clathrospora elynae]|uniref:Cytochrome b561 domain-containing protein n=1 Tax=Clathrospora elynae TaxID=706981 RepID=A0A6A5T719_9PLEO|nr:hypothetical protein EJ02DRAFT_90856 [Clathrospora elynae]
MALSLRAILFSIASSAVSAQSGPGSHFGPPGVSDNSGNDNGSFHGAEHISSAMTTRRKLLTAHGILAALAFVLLMPVGSIMIRVGSFRGVWIIHGLFQVFAYLVYTTSFGIGLWIVLTAPVQLIDNYHVVIGILVFVLCFIQPISGWVHHVMFKNYSRRTVWSYGHLWIGRAVVTLGIINGGLGLYLASGAPAATGLAPSRGGIIAYGVVSGIMWLLWVAVAVHGEWKRTTSRKADNEVHGRSSGSGGSPTPSTHNKENYAVRTYA